MFLSNKESEQCVVCNHTWTFSIGMKKAVRLAFYKKKIYIYWGNGKDLDYCGVVGDKANHLVYCFKMCTTYTCFMICPSIHGRLVEKIDLIPILEVRMLKSEEITFCSGSCKGVTRGPEYRHATSSLCSPHVSQRTCNKRAGCHPSLIWRWAG